MPMLLPLSLRLPAQKLKSSKISSLTNGRFEDLPVQIVPGDFFRADVSRKDILHPGSSRNTGIPDPGSGVQTENKQAPAHASFFSRISSSI
jgi:hypothetical protein